jgi:hypothetical protein
MEIPMIYDRHTIAAIVLLFAVNTFVHPGPFDGREFKGRIAFSSDGNYNDEDDWGGVSGPIFF